jgi:hypothetical protein
VPCLGYVFTERRAPHSKLALLGDTSDASALAPLAAHADILVHEATVAPLPRHLKRPNAFAASRRADADLAGLQDAPGAADAEAEAAAKAVSIGHSTPTMAGAFARAIGAGALFLNHLGTPCAVPSAPGAPTAHHPGSPGSRTRARPTGMGSTHRPGSARRRRSRSSSGRRRTRGSARTRSGSARTSGTPSPRTTRSRSR